MPDLQPFAKHLWLADGPNVRDFGVMFTTRMSVAKLSDGSLWVNSPVSVPSDTLERIKGLGPVKYLVAGTPRHVCGWKNGTRSFPKRSYGRRGPRRSP